MSDKELSEKISLLAMEDNKNVLLNYNKVLGWIALPLSIIGVWIGINEGVRWEFFFIMGAAFAMGGLHISKYLDKKLKAGVKKEVKGK